MHDNWLFELIRAAGTDGSMFVICSLSSSRVISPQGLFRELIAIVIMQVAKFGNRFLFLLFNHGDVGKLSRRTNLFCHPNIFFSDFSFPACHF